MLVQTNPGSVQTQFPQTDFRKCFLPSEVSVIKCFKLLKHKMGWLFSYLTENTCWWLFSLPSKFLGLNQMCRVKIWYIKILRSVILMQLLLQIFFSHTFFLRLFLFFFFPIYIKSRSNFLYQTPPYLIFCISKPAASKSNRIHVWPWTRIAACKVWKGNMKKYVNDFFQRILFIAKKTKSLNKSLSVANITQWMLAFLFPEIRLWLDELFWTFNYV